MFSEKNNIKEKMSAVIDYVEVSEGVQIAVNQDFINRFANSTLNSLFDFYKCLLTEISKCKDNTLMNTDVIAKINF